MDPYILYIVSLPPERSPDPATVDEARSTFARLSGYPCRVLHYQQLEDGGFGAHPPRAILYSGGAASPVFPDEPVFSHELFQRLVRTFEGPQLAICRSAQIVATWFGGRLAPIESDRDPAGSPVDRRDGHLFEFGVSPVQIAAGGSPLFAGLPGEIRVHQNHRFEMKALGRDLEVIASNGFCPIQGWQHRRKPLYGLQFHPERGGEAHGRRIVQNFFQLIR